MAQRAASQKAAIFRLRWTSSLSRRSLVAASSSSSSSSTRSSRNAAVAIETASTSLPAPATRTDPPHPPTATSPIACLHTARSPGPPAPAQVPVLAPVRLFVAPRALADQDQPVPTIIPAVTPPTMAHITKVNMETAPLSQSGTGLRCSRPQSLVEAVRTCLWQEVVSVNLSSLIWIIISALASGRRFSTPLSNSKTFR